MFTDDEIIPPPKYCDTCQRPGAITLIEVYRNKTSEVLRGPFAEFQEHGAKKRVLRSAFRFKAWWVRCADHYSEELTP